jgi:Pycsar effector protein
LPPGANDLFFGDFTRVAPEVWIEHRGGILASDAAIYRAILLDLHAQGDYLIRMKYRSLRAGYLAFLAGFLATALAQLVAWGLSG